MQLENFELKKEVKAHIYSTALLLDSHNINLKEINMGRTWVGVLLFLSIVAYDLKGEENFLLINRTTSIVIKEFGSNIYERTTPACSFNIVLSLIGYDAKILQTEKKPLW